MLVTLCLLINQMGNKLVTHVADMPKIALYEVFREHVAHTYNRIHTHTHTRTHPYTRTGSLTNWHSCRRLSRHNNVDFKAKLLESFVALSRSLVATHGVLSVALSVCRYVCLSVSLFVCLSLFCSRLVLLSASDCLFLLMSFKLLSVGLSFHLPISLAVPFSIYSPLSTYSPPSRPLSTSLSVSFSLSFSLLLSLSLPYFPPLYISLPFPSNTNDK